jgi:pyruvate dehydrogenase E1 component alpha subunit
MMRVGNDRKSLSNGITGEVEMKVEGISGETLLEMYRLMFTIRLFEDKAKDLYMHGKVRGTLHLTTGQEAVAAGACMAINPEDYIVTNHRGHGHCIAKGVTPKSLLAEILGRKTGCCGGRAGSMHALDVEHGVMGACAVVGGGLPLSTGIALGIQQLASDRVVLCFFGDGAANQGAFHEAVNLASVWKLPAVYICENNQIGDTTPYRETTNIANIAERAASYGIPGVIIDGNDVLAVYKTIKKVVARARAGEGPTLVECKTYRWEGHNVGDPEVYRTREEVKAWREKCPIKRLAKVLEENNIAGEEAIREIEIKVQNEIDDAEQFAFDSPSPDPSEVMDYVWA